MLIEQCVLDDELAYGRRKSPNIEFAVTAADGTYGQIAGQGNHELLRIIGLAA
ncbi:Unknown protein sequence [Pseudomonas syringae pv. cilantro]|uniref:Uncharacterized protein n=1 Tax=Pseudomonas syringae pv. cilantro TaxID=81035 RepID=A0A0N0GF89_PSESX|nr:Unknown protein sequence [Pseudomonas syringae pv. cilantro]